jgi:hypothetical protein
VFPVETLTEAEVACIRSQSEKVEVNNGGMTGAVTGQYRDRVMKVLTGSQREDVLADDEHYNENNMLT